MNSVTNNKSDAQNLIEDIVTFFSFFFSGFLMYKKTMGYKGTFFRFLKSDIFALIVGMFYGFVSAMVSAFSMNLMGYNDPQDKPVVNTVSTFAFIIACLYKRYKRMKRIVSGGETRMVYLFFIDVIRWFITDLTRDNVGEIYKKLGFNFGRRSRKLRRSKRRHSKRMSNRRSRKYKLKSKLP